MDRRKDAAAVSAAGLLLVAGCAGGGTMSRSALPNVPAPQSTSQNFVAPANAQKMSLRFTVPARRLAAWVKPTHVLPARAKTRKTFASGAKRHVVAGVARTPQYVPYGVLGGTMVIKIYQNGQSAIADQTLIVGTAATSPIYCGVFYSGYTTYDACYNNPPYGNIYAPLGSDTFFVEMYDSAGNLLAVTPGLPNGNFNGAPAPSAYTVTSSGGSIAVSAYAVASFFGIDAPSSCIAPEFGGWAVPTFVFDAEGYPISAPLANPVTITTTGGFGLFDVYGPLASTYTIYDTTSDLFSFAPTSDGATGSVTTNISINKGTAQTMNLYAVDRLAFVPTAGALNQVGLYDGGPTAFNCGAVKLAAYDTGAPITLSNPQGAVSDDSAQVVGIGDVAASSTIIDVVEAAQYAFGFDFETGFIPAFPTSQVTFSGLTQPVDAAISSAGSGGDEKIYVLDASGSVEAVDYSAFAPPSSGAVSDGSFASGATTPKGLAVFFNYNGSDSLVVADAGSNVFRQIDNVPSAPSGSTFALNSIFSFSGSAYTTSAFFDSTSGNVMVRVFDSPSASLLTCNLSTIFSLYGNNSCTQYANIEAGLSTASFGSSSQGGDSIAQGVSGSTLFVLDGSSIYQTNEFPPSLYGTIATGISNPTRIVSSYDGVWTGISSSSGVDFFSNLASGSGTSLIRIAGAPGTTILSPTSQP